MGARGFVYGFGFFIHVSFYQVFLNNKREMALCDQDRYRYIALGFNHRIHSKIFYTWPEF